MADYYSLLARKVASLEQSTPQSRKAIYDVARKALLNQLRSIKPPIAEEVIAAEEHALDEAVARVEAEAEVQALPEAPPEKPGSGIPCPAAARSLGRARPVEQASGRSPSPWWRCDSDRPLGSRRRTPPRARSAGSC